MTVAVAHRVSASSRTVLTEAAKQAALRDTTLHVLHVAGSLDLDSREAYRRGISDEVEKVLADAQLASVTWQVQLGTGEEDIADDLLKLIDDIDAEVLVIGARRRSPVGKFLMGSVAQRIILEAPVPVLVVKATG